MDDLILYYLSSTDRLVEVFNAVSGTNELQQPYQVIASELADRELIRIGINQAFLIGVHNSNSQHADFVALVFTDDYVDAIVAASTVIEHH